MKKSIVITLLICLTMSVLFTSCSSSNSELQVDDFDIYEDGILVLKSTDPDAQVSFEILQQYDLKDRTLETKRGIKLGSTAREVAEAYKNIPIGFSPFKTIPEGDFTYEDLLDNIDTYVDDPAPKASWDYIVIYEFIDENGNRYRLNICIRDGIVANIIIAYTTKEEIDAFNEAISK